jgi:thiamine-phosphate pyrophosphorylase
VSSQAVFPTLYPILDAGVLSQDPALRRGELLRLVRCVVDTGVTILQYRNKYDSDAQVLEDARWIRDAAGPEPTLILNDRVHLVEQAAFDGVHVGQQDMPPAEARRILGPDRVLGVSTHSPDQVAAVAHATVDYIAIGPVFATASKENPDPVAGLEGVQAARRLTRKPLVAIGGITPQTAQAVMEAGADSIAAIAAIFGHGPGPGQGVEHVSAVNPEQAGKNAEDFLRLFR